jgi:hypothetical protein
MRYSGQPKLPKWSAVLERWDEHKVPEVEISEFKIGEQYPTLPWLKRSTGRQLIGSSNPQNETAYHICKHLPAQPSEFIAAYKLYAFCREHLLDEFSSGLLHPVFNKHKTELYEWWRGNARYVLPPVKDAPWNVRSQAFRWESVVDEAARCWTLLAEQWLVIEIPSFMDVESRLYGAYREYAKRLHDERERAEYLYLKQKFEGE